MLVTLLICLLTTHNIHGKNLIEDTISAGYGMEHHNVTTEDGYILTVHRIPYHKSETEHAPQRKPVIFLMHDMMGTSANFINQGPRSKIAFTLVHEGYDVWLGNARGNPFSRAHETLNPDDKTDKHVFFNFGWEDIAIFDMPAMIDYIIKLTGVQQISYIGDAQGGTYFMILNSLKPEYNKKFLAAQLLDPVGYTEHFRSAELKTAAFAIDSLYALGQAAGIAELSSWNMGTYQPDVPASPQLALQGVVSYIASLGGYTPIGTSLKQLAHYAQNIRDSAFRRWDYGVIGNGKIYGTKQPPPYALRRVTAYVTLYYQKNHPFVDERDVLAMGKAMPNAKTVMINMSTFSPKDLVDYTRTKGQ